jgi:ABC-type spermidine/putrescine transport system permease subunit II
LPGFRSTARRRSRHSGPHSSDARPRSRPSPAREATYHARQRHRAREGHRYVGHLTLAPHIAEPFERRVEDRKRDATIRALERHFRRPFPGAGVVFYLVVSSLVMPSLLVGFGIGLGFQFLGLQPELFTSALGAQLTWTPPFGLLGMFAVVNRFDRSWEEAASDLGATPFQRLRYVTVPILLPGILGVALSAFTLSYDEYARTTLTIGARNTLPLEIYALISSATTPMLFALGTLTTAVSFLLIGITVFVMLQMQQRRQARR